MYASLGSAAVRPELRKRKMPHQMSTITILQAADNPHQFILVRSDFPDFDKEYVWCGNAGWQPRNTTTELLAKVFHSEAEAKRAADKTATLPLRE